MPYSNDGIGFNANSYTSWLAAQKQSGKRETQKLRIRGLFSVGFGIWRQGCLGVCSWHVKTAFSEMFANGRTTAWTARLADMVKEGELTKLKALDGGFESWTDPEGARRELYFRTEDVNKIPNEFQSSLFP